MSTTILHETHKVTLRELLKMWDESVKLWREARSCGPTIYNLKTMRYLAAANELLRFDLGKPHNIACGGAI